MWKPCGGPHNPRADSEHEIQALTERPSAHAAKRFEGVNLGKNVAGGAAGSKRETVPGDVPEQGQTESLANRHRLPKDSGPGCRSRRGRSQVSGSNCTSRS